MPGTSRDDTTRKSSAETTAGFLSTAVLALLIAHLVWQAVKAQDSPPEVTFQIGEIVSDEIGWTVLFEARNTGGRTAADLTILCELVGGAEVVELREAHLDYLPPRGSRTGGVYFGQDPRKLSIRCAAGSFSDP